MMRQEFEVIAEGFSREGELDKTQAEERVSKLVALGQALSDPIRVRMLGLMAAAISEGRGCCGLPDLGVPASDGEGALGICVCEFEDYFGMGQSKVSYHLRKLKDAALVQEEKRGKWSFYSLDREAVQQLLHETGGHLGALVDPAAKI
jgi:ArsR family transcriptional regulator